MNANLTRSPHPNPSTLSTRRPSVLSANSLYLVSMLLVVGAGSALQNWSVSWGLLATELGLILLPTLLWLRGAGLDARETLQLRWPGGRMVILAAVIGAGTWALAVILEGVSAALFGYTPPSPFAAMPTDPLNLAVFTIALAVAAPICEETLFRGYLLSAYSRYGRMVSLVAVSLLFAFFHLRLHGLPALLPIAFALGYLAQRSRSLAPAVIAHAVNNGLSAGLVVATSLWPEISSNPAWQAALGGGLFFSLLLALVAFWQLRRGAPAPQAAEPPAPAEGRAFWPLAGAALIYLAFAGFELVAGRFPHWLAEPALRLEPAPWAQPLTLKYELRNVLDEAVGEAECTFTPQDGQVAFECVSRQRRFEAHLGNSLYAGGAYELRQTGHWQASTMRLLDAQFEFEGEYDDWTAALAPAADGLSLTLDQAASQAVPAESVVAAEWPWRMMALPFGRFLYWGSRLTLVQLRPGDGSGGSEPAAVLVRGQETVRTGEGPVLTWKVALGRETAWYRVDGPHELIQYSDGYGVTWVRRATP